jgi:hypothetical protein
VANKSGSGQVRFDQVSGLLELTRWQGRGIRRDFSAGPGLMENCYSAVELGLPPDFVSSSLCVLELHSAHMGASTAMVRAEFPSVYEHMRQNERRNTASLLKIRHLIEGVGLDPGQVLLLGECAVLLGLYGSLAAFEARTWAIGLPASAVTDEGSVVEKAISADSHEIHFGRMGRLEPMLGDLSLQVTAQGCGDWKVPDLRLLTVILAARVGDPEARPDSPAWAQLAVALKGKKDEISVDSMLDLADELEISARVHRGLFIVRTLFPELSRRIPVQRLSVPAWERVALRVAANKLVRSVVEEDD